MTKEKVINGIIDNKPESSPLPVIPNFQSKKENVTDVFHASVERGGGRCFWTPEMAEIEAKVKQLFPEAGIIVSTISGSEFFSDISHRTPQDELKKIDVAVVPALIGVGENGACWVTEENCKNRVLPFITQHLVVVIKEKQLVYNMHQAYERISSEHKFGVFIAGPSKTADIEQALVIGAQAARSLTVFVLKTP